jgi:hypothetical protein
MSIYKSGKLFVQIGNILKGENPVRHPATEAQLYQFVRLAFAVHEVQPGMLPDNQICFMQQCPKFCKNV